MREERRQEPRYILRSRENRLPSGYRSMNSIPAEFRWHSTRFSLYVMSCRAMVIWDVLCELIISFRFVFILASLFSCSLESLSNYVQIDNSNWRQHTFIPVLCYVETWKLTDFFQFSRLIWLNEQLNCIHCIVYEYV